MNLQLRNFQDFSWTKRKTFFDTRKW